MTSFVWRSSDRRSDVCFSDLLLLSQSAQIRLKNIRFEGNRVLYPNGTAVRFAKTANTDDMDAMVDDCEFEGLHICVDHVGRGLYLRRNIIALRSEAHTSELQSLMRISSAFFCLKKNTSQHCNTNTTLK